MKKQLLWTTAALLTTVGMPLSSYAEPNEAVNPTRVNTQVKTAHTVPPAQPKDVVKVGEYQTQVGTQAKDTVIARIQPHEVAGRKAATLYVRDLPVLTFLGSSPVAASDTGATAFDGRGVTYSGETRVATTRNLGNVKKQAGAGTNDNTHANNDPVWRATAVAARLNQLNLNGVDAGKITVNWKAGEKSPISSQDATAIQSRSDRYLIKVNGEELVEINAETRLPDTTKDLAEDALQATNRLRRLLGSAPPLREIAGKPVVPLDKLTPKFSLASVQSRLRGLASWYGPGFHGNRSASGEIYNQNALTAAHRSLPFGTKVRVTNVRNGHSVVVRINDRGPFVGGRIIDLSAAAARILGVMQTGVAPVRIEVVD